MKPIKSISTQINTTTQDKHDDDAPSIVKKAINRVTRGTISANRYNEHNYVSMINKCSHLTSEQRNDLLRLFSQYEELFRLESVLQQLRRNNLHVHVEETFLASQRTRLRPIYEGSIISDG